MTEIKDKANNTVLRTNDIALIKLDRPTNILPVCMPYNLPNKLTFPSNNTILNIFTWGKISKF